MGASRTVQRPRRYNPAEIRAVFERWHSGAETEDGEQRMFCPVCEDPATSNSPSASMNAVKGDWNCLTGDHGGSIYSLVRKLGLEKRFGRAATAETSKPEAVSQQPLPDQNAPQRYARALQGNKALRAWVLEQRGITAVSLARAEVGTKDGAFVFPVQTAGEYVQTKSIRYRDGKKERPYQTKGAKTRLWPQQWLAERPDVPVLLCEGEWDAVLADQHSSGHYVAVTGTSGAKAAPRDLSLLRGREVFVAYDLDDAGRAGAKKVQAALEKAGARAYVLDLSRVGVPASQDKADVSDYFHKYNGSAAALLVEFDRLRREQPASQDDVLAAIQELFLADGDERSTLISDVRSDDEILRMEPARFVIDGWLPVGFFSDFFGEPGSRKTFVILDMLRHIRAGLPWHGHAVTQGATLLFEGEGLEQLQTRIEAWDAFYDTPTLVAGGSLSVPVNATTPEGIASVVRTVRDFEAQEGVPVVAVAFDPLVEYMTGDENTEGMALVTLGLRALARYLDVAVVVGAHTNAAGERARGGDQLRMRSGAHVRVETLKGDYVGLVQEKQKNGQRLALRLVPQPVAGSLVLSSPQRMSASEYYASKDRTAYEQAAQSKTVLSAVAAELKQPIATKLLTDYVRDNPGVSRGKLLGACTGKGVGKPGLEARLDDLIKTGAVRVEKTGSNARAPHQHFLVETPDEGSGDE